MSSLKEKTKGAIKWNLVDKIAAQILYAVTGIILARLISKEDFGLVGAVLVFQAFASMFVDSGFASALIQRKAPSERDYSTVFWFNMLMALALFIILWFCAPMIARWNQGDMRLIPLARVMFLTFIFNAAGIVQTNRMIKQMNVRPVALANLLGQILGAAIGLYLALTRADAWALVWQQVSMAAARALFLWLFIRWRPMLFFSLQILRSFFAIGSGVMLQSFLNTVFQNVYAFFIGHRIGMVPLGVYSQADKWSKMATATVSQVLTSSFVPALAEVQDSPERLRAMTRKIHRSVIAVTVPAFIAAILLAAPAFHLLFGSKWDAAIPLFQILMARGIFVVLNGLYSNFLLAIGRPRLLVVTELIRDSVALIALIITLPFLARPNGLALLIWGQFAATLLTWAATLPMTKKAITQKTAKIS
ncbi:MAG: lipopolysaccharide biosynthesis protein [Bacteroides sp.]|nr:lipopolysaccharide biosynthesis protein [Bacteroides sp.]MBD5293198.1 lipopolysaccharide biosynthesis protein [Bacteroides sp.]